eukprot:EC819548.1.p2 GENE.EC819548.1~~EC819548.1.p2  ORF type:complete len:64 (+),score=34.22 EC819548.1:201-392(+)
MNGLKEEVKNDNIHTSTVQICGYIGKPGCGGNLDPCNIAKVYFNEIEQTDAKLWKSDILVLPN